MHTFPCGLSTETLCVNEHICPLEKKINSNVGTQPTDVQQLKAEIALLCTELEEALCYRGRSVNEIIAYMRQLSAV